MLNPLGYFIRVIFTRAFKLQRLLPLKRIVTFFRHVIIITQDNACQARFRTIIFILKKDNDSGTPDA